MIFITYVEVSSRGFSNYTIEYYFFIKFHNICLVCLIIVNCGNFARKTMNFIQFFNKKILIQICVCRYFINSDAKISE